MKNLISGWSLGNDNGLLVFVYVIIFIWVKVQTRIAIVGNGILGLIDTTNYYTVIPSTLLTNYAKQFQDALSVQNTLNQMSTEASLYGLTSIHFDELVNSHEIIAFFVDWCLGLIANTMLTTHIQLEISLRLKNGFLSLRLRSKVWKKKFEWFMVSAKLLTSWKHKQRSQIWRVLTLKFPSLLFHPQKMIFSIH